MAYVSQDLKKRLTPGIKNVLNAYGMKWTISVNNHSTLVVTVTSGDIYFPAYNNTNCYPLGFNEYWIKDNHEGIQRDFLLDLREAMMKWNWDNSDSQSDYFDKGWYISIRIGSWNKLYKHNPSK